MFNPDQPRDEIGRWTDTGINAATEIHTNMDATRGLQGAASDEIDILMWRALETGPELGEFTQAVANDVDGTSTPVNYKSRDSIARKAAKEYGGDVSQLTDAARTTVVVEYSDLEKAAKRIGADSRTLKVRVQEGDEYHGYRGVLANAKMANGLTVEIQANSPGMIYAKEPKKVALSYMTEETYNRVAAKVNGLEGGKGHVFYEKIRDIPKENITEHQKAEREKLIRESKEYYSHFYGL